MGSTFFQEIKEAYLIVIDNKIAPEKRRISANFIGNKIIQYCFNKDERKKRMFSINRERNRKINEKEITHSRHEDQTYQNHVYGHLNFLCAYEYILPKLLYAFELLLSRGHNEKNSEELDEKPEISFLSLHEVLNIILEWFLKDEKEDSSYIIPVHFIVKDDTNIQKLKAKQISSFLNRKKNESWFIRNRTILSYLVVLLPILLVIYALLDSYYYDPLDYYNNEISSFKKFINSPVTLLGYLLLITIISVFGIFKTYKYVFKKSLRTIRYTIFGVGLLPSLGILFFAVKLLIPQTEDPYPVFLDPDPNNNGMGFFTISGVSTNGEDKKYIYINFSENSFGERQRFLDLNLEFKNLGDLPLESEILQFQYNFLENSDLVIQASTRGFGYKNEPIYDVVRISGLKSNETLRYVSASIFEYKKVDVKETPSDSTTLSFEPDIGANIPFDNLFVENSNNSRIKLPVIPSINNSDISSIKITLLMKIYDDIKSDVESDIATDASKK